MLPASERFQVFSGQHYLLLALFAVSAVGIVLLGRTQRTGSASLVTRRVLAVAILFVSVPSQVYWLSPGVFDAGSSIPLELCDLAWMTAVWALWTQRPLPTALTYYWGLTLTLQGVLTPSLSHVFPEYEFFVFWAKHILVVLAALYLTVGLGRGPSWRDYRWSVAVTAGWAVVVYGIDVALDANYGYLVRKPPSASLLDAMGPWPIYLLVSLGVLVSGWALITWPWAVRARRLRGEPAAP